MVAKRTSVFQRPFATIVHGQVNVSPKFTSLLDQLSRISYHE
jgi:hypothetical protein